MVDKVLVLRKLADIEEYQSQIREYSAISIFRNYVEFIITIKLIRLSLLPS